MKFTYSIFLTLSLSLLAACGSGSNNGTEQASTVEPAVAVNASNQTAQFNAEEAKIATQYDDFRWNVASTHQTACYDNTSEVQCPQRGQPFFGQDAQNPSARNASPDYKNNGDGTVTDPRTGLTWTYARYGKLTFREAFANARNVNLAGKNDWRVPTVKELYSLMDFKGYFGPSAAVSRPFLGKEFEFAYGNEAIGERFIDVQEWSATPYVGTTFNGDDTIFGVNFADGRIKGYPLFQPGSNKTVEQRMFVRYVRGKPSYGINSYVDNQDGTVTDLATRLVWQKFDDGVKRNWQDALAYCQALNFGASSKWRLPNAKELQSIVDYTRAPQPVYSNRYGAAIEPIFGVSAVESYYWTSTTLLDGPPELAASRAAYLAFGRALGYVEVPPQSGNVQLIDVHGAGAQRADPKAGDPSQYPRGFGPQGDDVRIYNFTRCVRR